MAKCWTDKMKLSDTKERLEQRPLRPFAIETTGGSWIEVEKDPEFYPSEARIQMELSGPNGGAIPVAINPIEIVLSQTGTGNGSPFPVRDERTVAPLQELPEPEDQVPAWAQAQNLVQSSASRRLR